MVRISGLFHLPINRVYRGYNPLILTFDPNFQPDIQIGNILNQWDFQGPPIMGPPYGKLPILFPYHSHKNP